MDYLATNVVSLRREGINNVVLDSEYSERLSTDRNRLGTDFKDVLKSTFMSEWSLTSKQLSLFTEDMLFGNGEPNEDVDILSETYRNRQAAAKHRAYKHYDWEVPAERAYPVDLYNEKPEMTDHALLPYM